MIIMSLDRLPMALSITFYLAELYDQIRYLFKYDTRECIYCNKSFKAKSDAIMCLDCLLDLFLSAKDATTSKLIKLIKQRRYKEYNPKTIQRKIIASAL